MAGTERLLSCRTWTISKLFSLSISPVKFGRLKEQMCSDGQLLPVIPTADKDSSSDQMNKSAKSSETPPCPIDIRSGTRARRATTIDLSKRTLCYFFGTAQSRPSPCPIATKPLPHNEAVSLQTTNFKWFWLLSQSKDNKLLGPCTRFP